MSDRRLASGERKTIQQVVALQTRGDRRYDIDVEAHHCVGENHARHLFGGVAAALAVRLLERELKLPVIWISIQFQAPTPIGAQLGLQVKSTVGKRVVQSIFTATAANMTVFVGTAAVGKSDRPIQVQHSAMPMSVPPEACETIAAHSEAHEDAHQLFDIRVPSGRFGIFGKQPVRTDGRVLAWIRPYCAPVDAVALAAMADFLPSTASNALNIRAGGSSLDNVFRVIRIVPTEWVMCDFVIEAIYNGIAHGSVRLYAEDGTLMALASQSFAVRVLERGLRPQNGDSRDD